MSGYVLLVSYPKSGNTWLRFMLETVRRNGEPPDLNEIGITNAAARRSLDLALDMESSDLSPTEVACARRWALMGQMDHQGSSHILKVHDANLAPPGTTSSLFTGPDIDRVVYIVRDPRDVVVSAAAFFGNTHAVQVTCLNDPEFMLGCSLDSLNPAAEQFVSSWSKHVSSWLDGEGYPLLLVRYEDMLTDTKHELERIVHFVGAPEQPEVILKAVEASRFSMLAAREKVCGFRENNSKASAPFFRHGIAGNWRDVLSADLVADIVWEHRVEMKRLGYEI